MPVADHVSPSDLSEALCKLLDAHAVPGQDHFVEGDATVEPWKSLLERSFISRLGQRVRVKSSGASRFQLTQEAMSKLETGAVYTSSRQVFAVRALPLPQLTGFEMARTLQLQGWSWHVMPKAVKDRQGLEHNTSLASGVWYSAGKTLVTPYLQCLLSASQLRDKYGVQAIPHYLASPVKQYTNLLRGEAVDVDLRRAPPRLALHNEFDDDDVIGPGAIADMEIEEAEEEQETLEDMLAHQLEAMLEQEELELQDDNEINDVVEDIVEPVQDIVEDEVKDVVRSVRCFL